MQVKSRSLRVVLLLAASAIVTVQAAAASGISEQQAYDIGVEAYVYTYPLLTMDLTRRQMTNVERAGQAPNRSPVNTLLHMRAYVAGGDKTVVRPNFDTLYSTAWIDVTREPMVLSVPDSGGRYYVIGMLDMWTDVFATPGTRSTGGGAASFAFVTPGWKGTLPEGVQRIEAPTPRFWMIGRTQTNGPKDYAAVHAFQDGMRLVPLSQWGRAGAAPLVQQPVDASVDMKTPPLRQVNAMSAAAYYPLAAELLTTTPPHANDQAVLARMKSIGIEAGKPFDLDHTEPQVHRALERAATDALKSITAKFRRATPPVNGWMAMTENIGTYGNSYLTRAAVALAGLGALPPEDAIYPTTFVDADNKPLTGASRYVLRFDKDRLPPANAFWSVTMYDNEGFQVPNALGRYAIGDRDALKFEPDGALVLYVQNESPGKDRESNWLPAPGGPFSLTMRLYDPKTSVAGGAWAPPPVKRIE